MMFVLILSTAWSQDAGNARLSDNDILDLVQMVHDELGLERRQQTGLYNILKDSYEEMKAIQDADLPEVEKLYRLRQNQIEADRSLQNLFTADQYIAYRRFVHGDSGEAEAPAPNTFAGRVERLATDLGLEGEKRDRFRAVLSDLETATGSIMQSSDPNAAGMDLLVAILVSDMDVIDVVGKPGYQEFHRRREAGALTGQPSNSRTDIATVLQFYDISSTLGLSRSQRKEVIRLIFEDEQRKQEIRASYANDPALLQEKMNQFERSALMRLQGVLTDKQIDQLVRLLSGTGIE